MVRRGDADARPDARPGVPGRPGDGVDEPVPDPSTAQARQDGEQRDLGRAPLVVELEVAETPWLPLVAVALPRCPGQTR